jgi:hypothetical protein
MGYVVRLAQELSQDRTEREIKIEWQSLVVYVWALIATRTLYTKIPFEPFHDLSYPTV